MFETNLCEEHSKKSKLKYSIDCCLIHSSNISINSLIIFHMIVTNSISGYILVPLFLGIGSALCLKSIYNDIIERIKNV